MPSFTQLIAIEILISLSPCGSLFFQGLKSKAVVRQQEALGTVGKSMAIFLFFRVCIPNGSVAWSHFGTEKYAVLTHRHFKSY